MKKILLIYVLTFLVGCFAKKEDSNLDNALVLLAFQPQTYQVSANITSASKAVSNGMVYFSKSTTTSGSTKAETTTTTDSSSTSTTTEPVFSTSAKTDEKGNITFTLNVGEYSAIITGLDNKSQAFKIKIEPVSANSLNKEGKATITFADGTVKVVILSVTNSTQLPPKSISYVCGYNPKGDTAPPELTSVEVGSDKLDLSSGSGKVTIKAKLAEGDEGTDEAKKASGIKKVTARLFSPKRVSGGGFSAHATLTLNQTSGLYEGDATLTNFVENGVWKVGLISARDNAGNERQYIIDKSKSEKTYSFNGCGQKIDSKIKAPEVTVSGSSPDVEAPAINVAGVTLKSVITGGATQDPIASNIDVSTSTATPKEVTITVTVTATDAGGTGIASGVSYIDARFQSYSWWLPGSNYLGNALYVRLERSAGTNTNGTYVGSVTIRSFAEGSISADGQWKLGGIWVNDKAGNGQFYSRDTLNKSFTIINASSTATADFYPPELKTITVDKSEVSFDQSFKISLDVADIGAETTSADQNASTTTGTTTTTTTTTQGSITPSGVRSVKAVLYSPLKLLDDTLGVTKSVSLTLNTTTSKYEGTSSFPSANNEEGGIWKVGWIEVVDNAGNYRVYRLKEGYNFYTYVKLTKTDGDISGSFVETNIVPISITRN
ncbi:MAG: hypothetical protein SFU98_11210 [Leptospiraceae bacterium]|nr:hypothetical protein [Leptospiraceae bacterium]